MNIKYPEFSFLKDKEAELILSLGRLILGMPEEELGSEFLKEADEYISNLNDFLQDDLRKLFFLFNSRTFGLLLVFRLKKFTAMDHELQNKYYEKWVRSRIPLFRTAASALRALCGWSYYSLEKSWGEINYPGKTIGREDVTPTLLEGKEKWYQGMELDV